MRFNFNSPQILICSVVAVFLLAQRSNQSVAAQMTSAIKGKIQSHLSESSNGSVSVFDRDGNVLKDYTISNEMRLSADSLEDYLKKDPAEKCEEPQATIPPPPCVICKSGKIMCSRASFGGKIVPQVE